MEIQLLLAFVAVAECRSFTAAAKQLHLTQSAVSKRLAQLEEYVGQTLFDRPGRKVHLTEAGAAMLPKVKSALEQIDAALQSITDFGVQIGGRLRIATSHHIGVHRLPSLLKRYVQQYPNVHLDLNFIDSEQASYAVIRGDYELCFVTLSDKIRNDPKHQLQSMPVWDDPLAFVCGQSHALAHHKRVRLEDLCNHPAIMPNPQTHTTQLTQKLFHQNGLALDVAMTTNHLDAIKMMISVGLGWSVLPRSLLCERSSLLPEDLWVIPVKHQLIRQLGCIYYRGRTLSKAARAMLALVDQV